MLRSKNGPARTFVQIEGRWRFEGNRATFLGPTEPGTPVGVCLSSSPFRSGTASVRVKLGARPQNSSARILIGYNAATGGYWTVGLGGYDRAYVTDAFNPGQGWRALDARGAASQLLPDHVHDIEAEITGQHVSLSVDHVRVLESVLPSPLQGNQAGLFAWGTEEIEFSDFRVSADEPRIFVVMQFGEPYDDLYQEVVLPASKDLGFAALRADDVFRPGVILQDIIRGIVDSDVVIAEITPVNANVFYELGYAHALNKPTILLANRNTEKLPFDVSSYRVIFYDDSIRGKRDIDATLRKHLESVRRGFGTE
jgi:hypothetical protein